MKIALVSPYDFGYPGGVTNHISHLAKEYLRAGHRVRILAPLSGGRDREYPDYFVPLGRTVPVPSGGSFARISLSIWLLRRLSRLLAREAFDVIHLHEPLAPYLPISVLEMSRSVNVGTFHAFHGSNRVYRWTSPALQRVVDHLDGRIAVSSVAASFVEQFFPGDYRIIPNGIDVIHFGQELPPFPEFADGKTNILFVGRMERRKGLQHLLSAYARVKWERPNTRLIVVGPGRLPRDCWHILSEHNLTDVVLVGGVPFRDLPRYYQSAHIYCSPATGMESFGIVLLEAMAAGRPIVASDIAGYRCVVEDGKQGVLVPPRDEIALTQALIRLIDDEDMQRRMGACGREHAQQYRWERVAPQVLEYYQELLDRRRGALPAAVGR